MATRPVRNSGAAYGISIFLGIVFLIAGGLKLAGIEMMVESFRGWGYSIGFMFLIGILEIVAALMILAPRTRLYGAVLLSLLMVGAIFTHISASEWILVPVPFVMLILSASVAWAQRGERALRERHA